MALNLGPSGGHLNYEVAAAFRELAKSMEVPGVVSCWDLVMCMVREDAPRGSKAGGLGIAGACALSLVQCRVMVTLEASHLCWSC